MLVPSAQFFQPGTPVPDEVYAAVAGGKLNYLKKAHARLLEQEGACLKCPDVICLPCLHVHI